MKKLIIILFTFLSLNSFSQSWYEMRGPLWLHYQNGGAVDSVKVYFSGTSVSFSTSKQRFNFTDPIATPTIDISGGYVKLSDGFDINTSSESSTGNLWINHATGLILNFYENELTIAPVTSFTNSITAPGYFTPTDTMETVDALRDSVIMLLDSIADLNLRTALSQQITSDDTTRWGTSSESCILNVSTSMSNIISSYYTNATLYAFCNTSDVTYTWSGPGSFSSNDKITVTNTSGLYRVIAEKVGCASDTSEIYIPGIFANNGNYLDIDTLKLFYSSKQAFMSFYTGTTNPTLTTRLNLDADLHIPTIFANTVTGSSNSSYGIYGYSSSGSAIYGNSTTGIACELVFDGSSSNSNPLLKLSRIISTPGNSTGDLISITDNPYSGGTVSGKVLSATIVTTERISLNPRIVDGSSAVGYMFDTHNSLSNATAKLLNIKNQGVNRFDINANGTLNIYSPSGIKKIATDTSGYIYHKMPDAFLYRSTDTIIAITQDIWYKFGPLSQKGVDGITVQQDSVQLIYPGDYTIKFILSIVGLNNEVWEGGIFKNSILEEPSQFNKTITTDEKQLVVETEVTSDGNDWITFKVRNTTDSDDITIRKIAVKIVTNHLTIQ